VTGFPPLSCPTCSNHPDVETEQDEPEPGMLYDCPDCGARWETDDTETDRLAVWALRVCAVVERELPEHDLRYQLHVLTEEINNHPDVKRMWWRQNSRSKS
jgi:hypothetical protein